MLGKKFDKEFLENYLKSFKDDIIRYEQLIVIAEGIIKLIEKEWKNNEIFSTVEFDE